ncbi:cyclin-T1-3-like [Pyrus ussuriensis x Pyrus communis]|uniref:B-like cyclin n=1 Tax=Pyrus ussuriensis x Pyrus communis TaxID=2448454 RepID=A0A5N5HWV5_9ROSA|nr:cyclin-T1-3-like [Pyrus ussuriensis x Pyrus communis]
MSAIGKDGISWMKESELRRSYCLFLRELGTKLKVGRYISTAIMLCHQFYMQQSHGKNDWKIVATSSMLLACKLVEEVRFLNDIVFVGYEIGEKFELGQKSSSGSIRHTEFFRKQRDLILLGERLVLQTIGPYDPIASALKRLNCSSYGDLGILAKSLIEECLQTTLCLEFKPHCIAAGSVAIVAEILKVQTPSTGLLQMNEKLWWQKFEVSQEQLHEVVQRMRGMLTRKADGKPVLCHPPLPKSNNGNYKVIWYQWYETSSRNPSASCSSSQSCVSIEETIDLQPTKKQRTSL